MKRHSLVHNGRFPKSEALYCSPNMISSTEILENLGWLSYKVQSSRYNVAMHDDIGNRSI